MQNHKAALCCRLGEANDVCVRHGARRHQLFLPQSFHRLQPVPQLCGLLKLQIFGSLQHLRPQILGQLLIVSGEKQPGLFHGIPVFRRAPAQLAPASALVHMVIQTGPILPQVSGKLLAAARQLQGQKDGPQYILGHSPAAIGAKIGRAIVGQLVNHCNFWILLRHIQPQVWIALIVFQEDVVLRQIPLDEGALQNQGFKLRRCNNDVKMVNFRHHCPGFRCMGRRILKILAHPVF